jgi:hypothetical protein
MQARMFDLAAVRQNALEPRPLQRVSAEALLTYPVSPDENSQAAANQQQGAAAAMPVTKAPGAAAPDVALEVSAAGWAPAVGMQLPATAASKAAAAAGASKAAGFKVRPSSQKSQLAFNRKELRLLLQTHGEYPADYRLLIWCARLRPRLIITASCDA